MRLRPEWPWRARRYKIIPDESTQYWYLFLLSPPPAMLFFHLSSDQWGQCGKYFWRSSLILQNSIALSSSLCILACWRRWINFFDTSLSEIEYSSWFNIGPNSFSNWYCSCGTARMFSSLWFCFGLWSACKILRIQFQRIFFELHFWGFLLVVVQIRDQFV